MMTAPTITLAKLKALRPCSYALHRDMLRAYKKGSSIKPATYTAAECREAGVSFNDTLWVLSALAIKDRDIARRLRMWASDCAARVLHICEKTGNSSAPRKAIVASRQYANSTIGAASWDAVRAAAWDDARAAACAAAWADAGVFCAARAPARDAAWAAAGAAAGDAAWAASRAAEAAGADKADAWAVAWDAASSDEKAWQFDRLIEWFGDNEPEPLPLPDSPQERDTSDAA